MAGFELAAGIVNVVQDGRFRRTEHFDPGDRQAMLARYAELVAGDGEES